MAQLILRKAYPCRLLYRMAQGHKPWGTAIMVQGTTKLRIAMIAGLVVALGSATAYADVVADCNESKINAVRISACTEIIADKEIPAGARAIAYRNRAGAYAERAANDEAIADYNEALRLNAKDVVAYAGRGRVWLTKGAIKDALADLSEAIRLEPNVASLFVARGYAHLVKGNKRAAIADYTAAIQLDPKNPTAYNNRGLAFRKKGDLKRALEDYTEAIRLNPSYPLAYNNRGYLFEAQGDKRAAAADFGKALSLDPSLVGAKKALKRIVGEPSPLAAETDKLIAEGQQLAQKNCAWCHAIGKTGNSPNERAPRWRDLHKRHPIQALRDPLTRGIARPHDEMPDFDLSDREIDVIIAYINSLSP